MLFGKKSPSKSEKIRIPNTEPSLRVSSSFHHEFYLFTCNLSFEHGLICLDTCKECTEDIDNEQSEVLKSRLEQG